MAQATTFSEPSSPPDARDDSASELSHGLVASLFGIVRQTRRTRREDPVEPAAAMVLASAARLSPARPSDIACELKLDLSTISRHLRNLEAEGHLGRREDPDDGRAQRVTPTAEGLAVLHRVLDNRAEVVDAAMSTWPEHERLQLAHLLRRLADDLGTSSAVRRSEGTDPA